MKRYLRSLSALAAVVLFAGCEASEYVNPNSTDAATATDTTGTKSVDTAGAPTATDAGASTDVTKTVYEDLDGDGYSSKIDCNDTNPDVHPGAEEKCDGIDNNCDGQTDEGLTITVFADHDKDGYGLSSESTIVCAGAEIPKGFVADHGGDCNDSAADANGDGKVDGFWINRGATETCDDGIDNNCDGQTDEGCAPEFAKMKTGDNFAILVSWPSDKVGQKIMGVQYYSLADIGSPWNLLEASATNQAMLIVPDGNACGLRFQTAFGDPANQWLCQDGQINPDAKIALIKADGSIENITSLVKPWSAPEGGCSANLQTNECK